MSDRKHTPAIGTITKTDRWIRMKKKIISVFSKHCYIHLPLPGAFAKEHNFFIIHAAKMYCIAFVFYGKTFVYQNCGETVFCRGKSVFIRTNAGKRVSVVIYNVNYCFFSLQ